MNEQPPNPEAVLDAELRKPQYATMGDGEAADAIMAKTVTVRVEVPANTLRRKLASLGKLSGILRVARNFDSPDPPYQQAATLMALIDAGESIDLDDPLVATGAPELVQHGLLSVEDVAAINAMADAVVRWVDTNGVGEVGVGAVINSRRRIAGA
jgi:hypothetical protein